jgi:hypothetical protein
MLKEWQERSDEVVGDRHLSRHHHDVLGLLKCATYCDLCAIFYDQFPPEQRAEVLKDCLEAGQVRICDKGRANGFGIQAMYPFCTSIVIDYWYGGHARKFSSAVMAIPVQNLGTSFQRVFLVF